LSDGQLLERFVAAGDETAFEALLVRHGPMVLGVCRRVLGDPAAAQDAFQATFLVLVRKAGSLRRGGPLGNWLYGVAYWTALHARAEEARRKARENRAPSREPVDPLGEITVRELLAVLDEELHRLSFRHRAPLIACYLEGKTRDTAARELGWSPATLGRRLERGRQLLGSRLARRGLNLPTALLATLLPQSTAPAMVPAELAAATLRAAGQVAAGGPAVTAASAKAALLSEGVLRAMSLTRLSVGVVLVLVGLLAAGAGLLAYQAAAAVPPDAPAGDSPKVPAQAPPWAGQPRDWQATAPPRREIPAAAIKTWAVAEFPLPRDRADVGIGEEVDLWVDGKLGKQPGGIIVWHIQGGGTVLPLVGVKSRMTVELSDRDGTLSIEAFHQPDSPAQARDAVDLPLWLKERLRDMPKRARHHVARKPHEGPTENRPELRAALNKLDGYRTGSRASLVEMDRFAGKLLQEFPDPGERGQIYYQLAHVHGQSGLLFPEKVREYSRKALALPLRPEQRFTLYVYCGDAHRVERGAVSAPEKRRRAAVRYLEGLKLLLPYKLPDKAPPLPAVNKLGGHIMPRGDPADPTFLREMQRYLREKDEHDKAWAARLQAEFIGKLVWEREVLAGQIVSLYHNQPAAWGEIQQMASAVLGDRAAVERLLAAVRSGKVWYT
jgi:RNA polymerase sigma factor (sigma-70 family)